MFRKIVAIAPVLIILSGPVFAFDRYVSYLLNHTGSPQLLRLEFACESETNCSIGTKEEMSVLDPAVGQLTKAPRGTYHALNYSDNSLLTLDIRNGLVIEVLPLSEDIYEGSSLLAFDSENQPWVMVGGTLHKIDPSTGFSAEQIQLGIFLEAMVFHRDSLFAAEGTRVLIIDVATGGIEELADHSSDWGASHAYNLASSGDLLWAIVDYGGQWPYFELVRVNPSTGDFVTGSSVAFFQRARSDLSGFTVRNLSVLSDWCRPARIAPAFLD